MESLVRRARNVYQDEGFWPVVTKSGRYLIRSIRHSFGKHGLYSSDRYLALLQWANAGYGKYDTLADPFKIIYVDPNQIEYVTGRGPNPGHFQWQDIGTVAGGDWDQTDERVDELPVVRALSRRFEEEKEWEEIEFIQQVLKQAEHGNVIWRGCTTEEDVWEACARVDRLYKNIRESGYRTKRELVEQGEVSPNKYVDGDQFNCYDEVVIDIGRDGRLLFVDGRHRLAIARILGLEKIPVRISARHARWQRIREAVADADDITDLSEPVSAHLGHPDLADFPEDG